MRPAREIRENKGLSLEQVARETELSIGHLARFERGEAKLGQDNLIKLAKALSVHVEELVEPQETAA